MVPALEIKNENDGAIEPITISWWKPHQIVLMSCCTASIIHTYLFTAVPSWLEL